MPQSPSKETADPMVGKAGVGHADGPAQHTGVEQREGESSRYLPSLCRSNPPPLLNSADEFIGG